MTEPAMTVEANNAVRAPLLPPKLYKLDKSATAGDCEEALRKVLHIPDSPNPVVSVKSLQPNLVEVTLTLAEGALTPPGQSSHDEVVLGHVTWELEQALAPVIIDKTRSNSFMAISREKLISAINTLSSQNDVDLAPTPIAHGYYTATIASEKPTTGEIFHS